MHRVGGNGFCGCSRETLLRLLQAARARRSASSSISRPRSPLDRAAHGDADLIVAADGINSAIRAALCRSFPAQRSICGPTSSPGWARRGRSTPSRSSSAKPSTASSSPIATSTSRSRSTWVIETDPETFARAGLDQLDEAAVRAISRRRVRRGAAGPPAHAPTARCGAISRRSATSAGSRTISS